MMNECLLGPMALRSCDNSAENHDPVPSNGDF